ncbi:hypothetical protein FRC04_003768 [Tulasnella sp. 424]|nr:hypothetical protein FRC04_003768 [Tulasnella sp. 424]
MYSTGQRDGTAVWKGPPGQEGPSGPSKSFYTVIQAKVPEVLYTPVKLCRKMMMLTRYKL